MYVIQAWLCLIWRQHNTNSRVEIFRYNTNYRYCHSRLPLGDFVGHVTCPLVFSRHVSKRVFFIVFFLSRRSLLGSCTCTFRLARSEQFGKLNSSLLFKKHLELITFFQFAENLIQTYIYIRFTRKIYDHLCLYGSEEFFHWVVNCDIHWPMLYGQCLLWAEALWVFEVSCEGIKTSTVLPYWQIPSD